MLQQAPTYRITCACGCGKIIETKNPNQKWFSASHKMSAFQKKNRVPQLRELKCACGCGETFKQKHIRQRYAAGHKPRY